MIVADKEKEQLKKSRREEAISNTNKNFLKICELSKNVQNSKYQYLPFWKEKESKILLKELTNPRKIFNTYKRGTIVRIDFGVNIGCEFSQTHYAIVLNKKDNRMSETLSVIPLTSKDKESNLNIGNVIFDNAMHILNQQMQEALNKMSSSITLDEKGLEELIHKDEFIESAYKLKKVIEYYSINPISSFACYRNIITVSKSRIQKPINEFDFINKAICDKTVMEKIDKEVLKYYTDIEILKN